MTAGGRRAFVLGGGMAGLTAAFGLRDRGFEVVLLESRGWLGGRAFSSPDRVTGAVLDNGPHVMLGCYRAMRALLRRLGTEGDFQQDPRLVMAHRTPAGRASRMLLSRLPAPLAMPLAMLRLPLGLGARCRALRGMLSLARSVPAEWSLADWFRRRGQLGGPDAWLWRPLCRAIMNTEPEEASAADFAATVREAFAGSAAAAAFWLPRRPWQEVVGGPAEHKLRDAGARVQLGARVGRLQIAGDRIESIGLGGLGDGEDIAVGPGDLVVSALPWFGLRTLLPGRLEALASIRSSPIVSAYFETREGASLLPDDGPVTALVEGDPFHFVLRTPGGDPRQFALMSGGNRVFDGMVVELIVEAAKAQLARYYPGWNGDGAVVRIRKEQHATFIASPGSRVSRPRPGALAGGPSNLRICGDWTDTGLPATLEGAARSAEQMLAREAAM